MNAAAKKFRQFVNGRIESMKLCKSLVLLGCTVALAACQSTTILSATDYNPQHHARIRLFGQNQKPTIMEYTENNKPVKVNVGGTLGDAVSSFMGATENISLGMPKTGMINYMRQYDGILSRVFYREFAVPGGAPVRVHNAFIGLASFTDTPYYKAYFQEASCRSNVVTFIPQAGKDYEIVPTSNSRACGVAVLTVPSNAKAE